MSSNDAIGGGPKDVSAPQSDASIDQPGRISEEIGTGRYARTAIVWLIIKWSFISGCGLTFLLWLLTYFGSYKISIEDIKTIWAIFVPLITLALGYAFGKRVE